MPTLKKSLNIPLSSEELRVLEAARITMLKILAKESESGDHTVLKMEIQHSDGNKEEFLFHGLTIKLLYRLISELDSDKKSFALHPETELTTQKAADFMKVSRPYFVKLLESGEIPFRLVGPRRRVRFSELLIYMEHVERESLRHEGLDELAAKAQKLNMY